MKLMTKAISQKAQEQYPLGSDMDQWIVAKFFDPQGSWSWYLMNQSPEDTDYLWGIVRGFEVEMGSFSLSELQNFRGRLGIGIERGAEEGDRVPSAYGPVNYQRLREIKTRLDPTNFFRLNANIPPFTPHG